MKHWNYFIILSTIFLSITPQIVVAQISKQLISDSKDASVSNNCIVGEKNSEKVIHINDVNDANLQVQLGDEFYQKGELDMAIDTYIKAIKLNGKLASAYYGLGNVLYNKDALNEANSAYSKVIDLEPNSSCAYSALGDVYFEQKIFDQAVNAYEKASSLNPDSNEIAKKLSEVRKRISQQPEETNEDLELPYNSVVLISSSNESNTHEATGWVLRRDKDRIFIITNRHVVIVDGESKPFKTIEVTFHDEDTKKYPATIVHVQKERKPDLAILQVDIHNSNITIKPLSFSPGKISSPTPVTIIGNPQISNGLHWYVQKGKISHCSHEQFNISDAELFEGNSGSPVLDQDNNVVGIVSEIRSPNGPTKGTIGFGVAYSIQFVKDQLLKLEFGL